MKKILQSFVYLLLLFYFELDLSKGSKNLFINLLLSKRKRSLFKIFFIQNILPCFANCLPKKCIDDNKSKLVFRFGQSKWIGEGVYCAKKIQLFPLLDPSRNRNNTVFGYVILRMSFIVNMVGSILCMVGTLLHLKRRCL